MKHILIACEESQTIATAFRERGFEAFSCDLLDCSGGHPEYHIKGDVLPLLLEPWDLVIAHPPCTYLTVTGIKWYNPKYNENVEERIKARQKAIDFFMCFVNAPCEKIAIENPVGIMSTLYRKPDQIIQPYNFGDPVSKKTCLWLKGLPKLIPTKHVEPTFIMFKSGKRLDKWYADIFNLPPEKRARVRSKTFQGIADAIVDQWSRVI